MSNAELRPPLDFSLWWLIVGLVLLALSAALVALVFIVTRKKKQRTLATLQPKPYTPPDISRLRAKYVQLLTQVGEDYHRRAISARDAHLSLSRLSRLFVYEANGHRVDTFTLSDLRQSRYQELAKLVESYYPAEFRRAESGNVERAVESAIKVVQSWS